MSEYSKKDLLELRIAGYPSSQGQVKPLISSSSEGDSNLSKLGGFNEESQQRSTAGESLDSLSQQNRAPAPKGRGRKRKSVCTESEKRLLRHEQQQQQQLVYEQSNITDQQLMHSPKLGSSFNYQTHMISSNVTHVVGSSKLSEVEIENLELKKRCTELECKLKEALENEKKTSASLESSRDWLKLMLIQDNKLRKKEALEQCINNCKRLGQCHTVRQGAQFVEQWQDGYAFKNIHSLTLENSRMKDELEKFKRQISKRKPVERGSMGTRSPIEKPRRSYTRGNLEEISNCGFASNPLPLSLTADEYHKLDELYKIRLATLKKEEADLNAELEKLEKERNLHMKELKRISNEEASRFNNNHIMKNRYLLLEQIGKGGFSEVFKAFDLQEFRFVACKIHQLCHDWKDEKKANYIKHAVREYNIHKTLDHPNIVKLLDLIEIDNNSFATIMEFCSGNDLDFVLKQQKTLPERESRSLILQVVSALRYLNERRPPVIHYDLKPGNLLLLSGLDAWHVKITDFGLSKIVPDDAGECSMELTSPGAGTYWYLPPECFSVGAQPTKISPKVDVWSVGVIFYQCLYGKKPFGHNLSQISILEQNTILKATNIEFPPKPAVSIEAKNFIRACLVYSKESRMDVMQMSECTYLKPKKAVERQQQQGLPLLKSTTPSILEVENAASPSKA